jgi:hypothetical protein
MAYISVMAWLKAMKYHACEKSKLIAADDPAYEAVRYQCLQCGNIFGIHKKLIVNRPLFYKEFFNKGFEERKALVDRLCEPYFECYGCLKDECPVGCIKEGLGVRGYPVEQSVKKMKTSKDCVVVGDYILSKGFEVEVTPTATITHAIICFPITKEIKATVSLSRFYLNQNFEEVEQTEKCSTDKSPEENKKPYTIIILQDTRVVFNGTFPECDINQSREVLPHYSMDKANWGQADSLHVTPGSECITICASSNLAASIAEGKHNIKK